MRLGTGPPRRPNEETMATVLEYTEKRTGQKRTLEWGGYTCVFAPEHEGGPWVGRIENDKIAKELLALGCFRVPPGGDLEVEAARERAWSAKEVWLEYFERRTKADGKDPGAPSKWRQEPPAKEPKHLVSDELPVTDAPESVVDAPQAPQATIAPGAVSGGMCEEEEAPEAQEEARGLITHFEPLQHEDGPPYRCPAPGCNYVHKKLAGINGHIWAAHNRGN